MGAKGRTVYDWICDRCSRHTTRESRPPTGDVRTQKVEGWHVGPDGRVYCPNCTAFCIEIVERGDIPG